MFLLIKPASSECNMACKYCFYTDVAENREIKNHGFMTEQTLEIMVQNALAETTYSCSFCFQGGEPTLVGLHFYEKLIFLQKKYNTNNVIIKNSIQTNGILIDEDWARFFKTNNFLVGISIDGTKDMHDSFRLLKNGKGSFNSCLKAVNIFKKYNVNFNILCVVNKLTAKHPQKIYNYFKKQDFRYIQFIPCLDGIGSEKADFSLNPQLYGSFLNNIFDLWYNDFVNNNYYSIRNFDNYIYMLMGAQPENCACAGECNSYPVIEGSGTVYPCDFYMLDEYSIGNINNDSIEKMLSSPLSLNFIQTSKIKDAKCLSCEYYFICRGGCRRERDYILENKLSVSKYCAAYKLFFSHTILRMKKIAYEQRNNFI